jgi:NADH:ubiquinone oxidoreductase subunit 6 (subunit J)
MFVILAVVILGSAIMCVFTKRIMRAATFLLFVLFGVAGMFFLLDYTYLGAAQISVYAGGITMLYVFAIQLDPPSHLATRCAMGTSHSYRHHR